MREMVCFLVDSLSSLGFSNVKSLTHFSMMLTHCVLNWQTQSILNVLYNFCLSYLTRLSTFFSSACIENQQLLLSFNKFHMFCSETVFG